MKNKLPPEVVAAEAARLAKAQELCSAQEAVKRLERELVEAIGAVRAARVAADAGLPKCRMVTLEWRTGRVSSDCEVVIVRKTPTGVLVVRRVGEDENHTFRFKVRVSVNGVRYVQSEKAPSFLSITRELRGVPKEFMPSKKGGAA